MALGIVIGTALGVVLDSIGAWLAIGIALGAGIENRISKKDNADQE